MSDFYPVSPIIGITNTSYGAQAGVMDEKWAVRVLRGKKIIAEKTIHQLDLDSFVGVVYGHIRVEGLSRHSIAQCAGRMMQYARKFQTSGVSPDYEVADLVREGEDGELISQGSTEDGIPIADTSKADVSTQKSEVDTRIGEFPDFTLLDPKQAWASSIEAQAALIARMATYGEALSKEHLDLMFGQTADELVYQWGLSSDLHNPILKFAELILGCTDEGQIPKTGKDNVTLETGTCELLKRFKEMDPDGSRFPPGYPCAFHEMIAERVAQRVGAEANLNTSSVGCIVTFHLKL